MSAEINLARLRDELLALGSAALYEASATDCFLPAALRPAWSGATIVGQALPVRASAGDNLALHLAVEAARQNEVIVVDAGGSAHGYWGKALTVAAQQRGVVGVVIDGGVRDTESLEALGFPVFSTGIAIEGTLNDDAGRVGDPIRIGRSTINRGDLVVADRDGVVVIPWTRVGEVVSSARSRAAQESEFLERIRRGELTMDVYGLR